MQPESVPSSLITAIDACIVGQPKAFLRAGDFVPEGMQVARSDGPHTRRPSQTRAAAELPLGPAQLKREKEHSLRGSRRQCVRCDHEQAPWKKFFLP